MSNVCEHGQLRRQCPHCENIESDKRIVDLEQELATLTTQGVEFAQVAEDLREELTEAKFKLEKAINTNIAWVDVYKDITKERDQLRQAVKQFVDEMDAQFPKLEMLPGEYDTLTKLVRRE